MLKPRFHITGATGWINDPNGMFQNRDGSYHVFYQVSSCRPGRLRPSPCPVLMRWSPARIWQSSQPATGVVCCMFDSVCVIAGCSKVPAMCSGIQLRLSGDRLIGVRLIASLLFVHTRLDGLSACAQRPCFHVPRIPCRAEWGTPSHSCEYVQAMS